ncbi:MAG: PfkB family carbohydrate kinase [Bacteroidales bacterium]|nr:PfkB family carbohydrate kinase [Bacteroidales bacterium]MDD3521325.1 PfkB family carbohydrate kinase [Bacteroidales bacterium]MDD4030611.1 PfkB family carbohydrate kinase [Bacteroidales bacterium]MDD4434700.1 PfkB family carbohydrate kinase [Bacteroidales bacterium]MDD5732188.1 PfkB family carbohydrate kinase [Bacteroidales bacterium]
MKEKLIVGIGEIVWDMFPAGKQLGGAPLNFAYFAKELSAKSYAISAIGSDALGEETFGKLSGSGVDVKCIQTNDLPTGRVIVTVDGEGIPQYEIIENVAWDAIGCSEEELRLVRNADAICWGSLAQRSKKSRSSILKMLDATSGDCIKVFDINLRQHYYKKEIIEESLKRTDFLKLNEDELLQVSEMFSLRGETVRVVDSLLKMFNLKEVIYTQGSVCSEVYDRNGLCSRIMTPKVNVADTVGAGDSFTAAYVVSRLDGKDVGSAHKTAVEISAFVCTQRGAINPLPEGILRSL